MQSRVSEDVFMRYYPDPILLLVLPVLHFSFDSSHYQLLVPDIDFNLSFC